jgi:hypothetical protein
LGLKGIGGAPWETKSCFMIRLDMVVEFINQLTTGRDHLVSWGYDGDIIGMILIIGSMPSGNQTN